MKTRYTPLVSVKKNTMQKSERVLQSANANLNSAVIALEISYSELHNISTPQTGQITEFLSARTLLDTQRAMIKHNEEWVEFAKNEIVQAKKQLKFDMVEFEKFNYLELEEVKKVLNEIKIQEAKELDEVALMTYAKKKNRGTFT